MYDPHARALLTRAKVASPILLKGRLAEPYYSEWILLVKAISTAIDFSIAKPAVAPLKYAFARFCAGCGCQK